MSPVVGGGGGEGAEVGGGRRGDSSRQERSVLVASVCPLQRWGWLGWFAVCQHAAACLAAVGARALGWLPPGGAPQLPPHQP